MISLVMWGSNLPLLAFTRSTSSLFDALVPFKLSMAKFEECMNSLLEQSMAIDEMRRDGYSHGSFGQCVRYDHEARR